MWLKRTDFRKVSNVVMIDKSDDWYEDDDYCYECQGYGDDYFINEDGKLESYCTYCPFGPFADDPRDE